MDAMLKHIIEEFDRLFGDVQTSRLFFSPGRVNIIGEHIDYNGGYVLPCTIDRGTYFVIRKNNTNKVRVFSAQFENMGMIEFDVQDDHKTGDYTDYVKGCIKIFDINFGFDVTCGGTIPHSSGLSSSASFTTGLGFALTTLKKKKVSGTPLALACQKIENEFMGVNCGIMDQFIVCNGQKDSAILLDCNTLQYKLIPFELGDYSLIIANTNKKRQLADSKYNIRRGECEKALEIINNAGNNYTCLCEIDKKELPEVLNLLEDDVLKRRVRHVVTENIRTVDATKALEKHNIEKLGELLTASHMSLEKDYEVTGKELDTLVHSFLNQEGCIGARMTGAGFGGCSIALIKKGYENEAIKNVSKIYLDTIGYEPSFYQVKVGNGTKEIKKTAIMKS